MAQSTLALVGANSSLAAVLRPYTLRSVGDFKAVYVGTGSDDTLAESRIFEISLDVKAPGVSGNNRVNWVFRKTVLNPVTNLPVTGSVSNKGLSIPVDTAWTPDLTVDLLKQAACYTAGVAATVSGQTDTSGYPALLAKCIIP